MILTLDKYSETYYPDEIVKGKIIINNVKNPNLMD
jgi:hypothetical protein